MAIYKYTLMKYLKSKSTWIIMLISGVLIGFFLGGALPMGLVDTKSSTATTDYTMAVMMSVSLASSFLAIFSSVFAGFKAASMYKDEVEDGTFLVILSKPMKRSTIIFMKWLALQTIIFIYTLFTVIMYIAGLAAFDKGSSIDGLSQYGVATVSSKALEVGGYIFVVLMATGLIFSSLGLLISTKLSVGSTIGISIALGIVIPITSIIGAITKKDEFKTFPNRTLQQDEQVFRLLADSPFTQTLSPALKQLVTETSNKIEKFIDTPEAQSIYKLAVATGDTNYYSLGWVLDLNYQIKQISSLATDVVVPESAKQLANDSAVGVSFANATNTKSTDKISTKIANQDFINSAIYKNVNTTLKNLLQGDGVLRAYANSNVEAVNAIIANPISNASLPTQVKISSRDQGSLQSFAAVYDKSTAKTLDQTLIDKMTQGTIKDFKDVVSILSWTYKDADFEKINNAKYETDQSNIDDWMKYQLNSVGSSLANALEDSLDDNVLDNIKTIFKNFTKSIDKVNNPVTSFLINDVKLNAATEKIVEQKGTEITDPNNPQEAKYKVIAGDFIAKNMPIFSSLTPKDQDAIIQIVASSLAGKLDEVKSVEYVNKYSLLVGYLVVALALVPLAYWVVKKQDFR